MARCIDNRISSHLRPPRPRCTQYSRNPANVSKKKFSAKNHDFSPSSSCQILRGPTLAMKTHTYMHENPSYRCLVVRFVHLDLEKICFRHLHTKIFHFSKRPGGDSLRGRAPTFLRAPARRKVLAHCRRWRVTSMHNFWDHSPANSGSYPKKSEKRPGGDVLVIIARFYPDFCTGLHITMQMNTDQTLKCSILGKSWVSNPQLCYFKFEISSTWVIWNVDRSNISHMSFC